MRWIFNRRADVPAIPPAPEPDIDPDAVARMEALHEQRARRGQWLTRHTHHAIAQNHFAQNMELAFAPRKPTEGK